ncbi:MYB family transcription factor [Musa troglodytarum]|uniref:MYB family transcription factor n=1 Tax=Musa troglodytarum TaxID=320322 RepID=A0A9E7JS01_9LILI|nr:MYB family transcription factor [Musa troglodytarum]
MVSVESCLGSSSGSALRRRNLLSRSNFRSYMFLKHNKQPLVDDRTNQHVNEQVRQPECDSHLAVVKVLPSRGMFRIFAFRSSLLDCDSHLASLDGLLKILNSNRDIKNVTTLAMDAKLLSVHVNHRADVPEWCSHSCKKIEESRHYASPVKLQLYLHKTDCSCLDEGSVRCIRRHTKEA